MKVKLISYTTPAAEIVEDGMNSLTHLISYCARVSNPANQNNVETSDKLIKYLIENKHWSPLEMVNLCLEIETTRDIARQFLRHRSFSFQEFSQRYADPTESLSFELRDARLQDPKNRQNSVELRSDNNLDKMIAEEWIFRQNQILNLVKDSYGWAVCNGIAKEQARAILPEGNTVSRMYVNGTIRSWVHYIDLRSGNGTQLEHRVIAHECADVITKVFPMITDFIQKKNSINI